MHNPLTIDFARIAQDLQIRKVQVENVVQLLDQGSTVPFIARYRKEQTAGLGEETIRRIQHRVGQMRQLADRKQTILKSIEGQGRLTDDLSKAILAADNPRRLDDLYLPFKGKKKSTAAAAAREKGLEPLALAIWNRDPAIARFDEVAPTIVNPEKGLATAEEVLEGVRQILAELISELAEVRGAARTVLWDTGMLCTARNEALPEGQGNNYKDYFQFKEPVRQIPPHRILAINRGEKENVLKVRLESDALALAKVVFEGIHNRPPALPLGDHPHAELLRSIAGDALQRLLLPALEREIRRDLTERAQEHAVHVVFARNLRSLLLQRPLRARPVLAIDPGFRSGCRVAALDENGNLLEEATIFPHHPLNKSDAARARLAEMLRKHRIRILAIGNGTACRETEELVGELIRIWPNVPPAPPEPRPAAAVPAAGQGTPAIPPPAAPVATSEAPPLAAATPEPPPPLPEAPPPAAPDGTLEAPPSSATGAAPSAEPAPPAVVPPPGSAAELPPTSSPSALEPPAGDPLPPMSPEEAGELFYVTVNEAGASAYAESPVAREEFPNLDRALRSAIFIGRRLQDPLGELVKIDPQSIGVGLYQHDVTPKQLKESLEAVVESCVNQVGVDLNRGGVPLLRYVAGLNPMAARELVEYRKQHGNFQSRDQLRQLPGMGEHRWTQAAGFLRIRGDHPLDRTWIHPESYPLAERLLADLGFTTDAINDPVRLSELQEKFKTLNRDETCDRLKVARGTLDDLIDALAMPGYDLRDDRPEPIFKKALLKLEDLVPGMELRGVVLNVVDFGAFVDVGLKDSGLVHISQMANRYIKNPYDVVAVGDVVKVWVLKVDQGSHHVSLSMIQPGTERKPPERRPPEERPPRGERPPPRGSPPRRDQGQGRGRPPRGPRRGPSPGPPAEGPAVAAPSTGSVSTGAEIAPAGTSSGPRQAGPPPRPQRRPSRPPPPKPKLSQAALEGAVPLHSFGELAAYLEAKRRPPPKREPPAQPEPTPSQEPGKEPPPVST
jgi:uncharacterized protein